MLKMGNIAFPTAKVKIEIMLTAVVRIRLPERLAGTEHPAYGADYTAKPDIPECRHGASSRWYEVQEKLC
jgi:hypothetical protein